MVNCHAPSQPKEGIGNGPSVVEDLAEKLIQQLTGHINQSECAPPKRTTQIRVEVELICRAVSASELFELSQTQAIEHKIEVTSDRIIKQRLRTVPHHYREQFKALLEEQIQAG